MLNYLENEDFNNDCNNNKKFNIVICEIFNYKYHGSPDDLDNNLNGHFLNLYKFNWKDVQEEDGVNINSLDYVWEIANLYYKNNKHMKRYRKEYYNYIINHTTIRNYKYIIENKNYIKPEIAQCFYLEGGHCITIIKTFWIRLIQRCWRKVLLERKKIFLKRMSVDALKYRELRGNWPKYCSYVPGIHNLLHLKNK